jgi:drug/metabolite transporter (DMT)-like permease
MKVMKHLSAFSVNLATNLEPVYSIILAIILFREDRELNLQFYLGVGLILASVFSYPYLRGVVGTRL